MFNCLPSTTCDSHDRSFVWLCFFSVRNLGECARCSVLERKDAFISIFSLKFLFRFVSLSTVARLSDRTDIDEYSASCESTLFTSSITVRESVSNETPSPVKYRMNVERPMSLSRSLSRTDSRASSTNLAFYLFPQRWTTNRNAVPSNETNATDRTSLKSDAYSLVTSPIE